MNLTKQNGIKKAHLVGKAQVQSEENNVYTPVAKMSSTTLFVVVTLCKI